MERFTVKRRGPFRWAHAVFLCSSSGLGAEQNNVTDALSRRNFLPLGEHEAQEGEVARRGREGGGDCDSFAGLLVRPQRMFGIEWVGPFDEMP